MHFVEWMSTMQRDFPDHATPRPDANPSRRDAVVALKGDFRLTLFEAPQQNRL
jgi:hypothetical protein